MDRGLKISEQLENRAAMKLNSYQILTERETEILTWLKEGKTSWDISKILSISERTVKFHVNNTLTKLNAVNRTHAVAKAILSKLI